jgi:FtsP/CotA-like multicopper oxidase with cupredoxin domain
MGENGKRQPLSRRDFIKMGGGLLGAAAGSALFRRALLEPKTVQAASGAYIPARSAGASTSAQPAAAAPDRHFVASDGWIYLPTDAPVPPYHPDNLAPPPFNCYIFGFRDVTAVSGNDELVYGQKMKMQLSAPLFQVEQEADFTIQLTNLGLQIRPDLIDSHTLHFHGFRNALPIFDGEPHSSVGVPIARNLTYFYRPHYPGTYMYHCHFEETEHVHMGMVGPCYVTPIQNYGMVEPGGPVVVTPAKLGGNTDPAAPRGYVYNDGDGSTAYDREFIMFLNEVWAEAHWCDSHIQLPEWSDYAPEFYLLNGRVWPDTLLPNGGGTDLTTGDLIPPPGHPELQYQPVSSLVQVNEGDRVLFRIINLGYEEQTMRLGGIKMKAVGKDATLLRGRNGADLTYWTNAVSVGAGESTDAIFVAPAHSGGPDYDTYLFYNRSYNSLNNGGHSGYGGQMTEVRVYPAGTLPEQTAPNT